MASLSPSAICPISVSSGTEATPDDTTLNSLIAPLLHSIAPDSGVEQDLEAAVDQPLAVERHRVDVGLDARVGHHLLHALVARLSRRPYDPGEDDGLVVLL